MKKKIIASLLAVSMMATLVTGLTLAYFTDTKTAPNTFTVGNVKILLTEPAWGGPEGPVWPDGNESRTVYAGEALPKDPTVTNDGANPCFVRIKVTGLNALVPESLRGTPAEGAWMITLSGISTAWTYNREDGYYYYTEVLEADRIENRLDKSPSGELIKAIQTPALFQQIVMPTALTNGDGTYRYNVTVTAQAVQAQGARPSWVAVQAMSVEDIAAWFGDKIPASNP